MIKEDSINKVCGKLLKKYPSEAVRINSCVRQVARLWDSRKDGPAAVFRKFCCDNFLCGPQLDGLLAKFESKLEQVGGHFLAMSLMLRLEVDEDTGPLGPADRLFASYSPDNHLMEDLFQAKLAFMALLNFPVKTLEERLAEGPGWSRDEWAAARLAQGFSHRVPAEVNRAVTEAVTDAEAYISSYNIFLSRVTAGGTELFPGGPKLISHWGLRDHLKGLYSDPQGLERQRVIQLIMERVIKQEIPAAAVNSDKHAWDPVENTLDGEKSSREPDTRYEKFLAVFRACQKEDPYFPVEPTHMDRSFKINREIPEADMEKMLTSLLEAPAGAEATALISSRLGRPLEPFDIWYDGFKPGSGMKTEELDRAVQARYPDVAAFQAGIPGILQKLGFSADTARFVAERVEVDPARGAGHAWGPRMRGEKAHLRTRVPKGGMDYQGFNTAMHELGHCTEQVFSMYRTDHTLLSGVPNTAFTEGFAFVFQDRDLDILGLSKPDPKALHLKNLDTFWSAREIAGVGLVDMNVWRWLYMNPDAEPADLRQAVIEISRGIWDRYYAPLFGAKGSPLLGIYSHMISSALYLPDYPLGYIIAFQVEEYFRGHSLAADMERMCVQGTVTPRQWMTGAVGADISPEPLIKAASLAAAALKGNR